MEIFWLFGMLLQQIELFLFIHQTLRCHPLEKRPPNIPPSYRKFQPSSGKVLWSIAETRIHLVESNWIHRQQNSQQTFAGVRVIVTVFRSDCHSLPWRKNGLYASNGSVFLEIFCSLIWNDVKSFAINDRWFQEFIETKVRHVIEFPTTKSKFISRLSELDIELERASTHLYQSSINWPICFGKMSVGPIFPMNRLGSGDGTFRRLQYERRHFMYT